MRTKHSRPLPSTTSTRHGVRAAHRVPCGLLVGLFLATSLFFAGTAGAEKVTLGLVPEGEGWGRHKELDAQAIHATTEAFFNTRRFEVTERAELAQIFEEKALQDVVGGDSGNLFDLQGLDMIGFVSYEVERLDGEVIYTLRVRLASVSTGEVLGTFDSVRISAFPSTSLSRAGDKLATNLRDAFPAEGIVVKVINDKKVVIDLGTSMGIKKGDTLVLFEDGEPIIHPETGLELPGQEIELGKLRVQSAGLQVATCKVASTDVPVEVLQKVRYQSKSSLLQRLPKPARRVLQGDWAEDVVGKLKDR